MAYKQNYTEALGFNPTDYSMAINPSGKGISIGMPCPTSGMGWYMHGHAPKFRNMTTSNAALANKNYTMKNPPSVKCPLIVNGNMVPNFPSYLNYDNGGVGVYTNGFHTPFDMHMPSSMFCGYIQRASRAKVFTGSGNTHTVLKSKHNAVRIGDMILDQVICDYVGEPMGGESGQTIQTVTVNIPRISDSTIASASSRNGGFGEADHPASYYTQCKVLGMRPYTLSANCIPISVAQTSSTSFQVTMLLYCDYMEYRGSSAVMGKWSSSSYIRPVFTVLYYGDSKASSSYQTVVEDNTGVTRIGTSNNVRSSTNKNALYFSNPSCGSPIGITGYNKSGTGSSFVEVTNTTAVANKEAELGFGITTANAIGYEVNGYWSVQNELRVNHLRISDSVFKSGTYNLTYLNGGQIGWSRCCRDTLKSSPTNDAYHGTFQAIKEGRVANSDLRSDAIETVTWRDTKYSPPRTMTSTKLKAAYANANCSGGIHNNHVCASGLRQTTDHETWTSMINQNFEV